MTEPKFGEAPVNTDFWYLKAGLYHQEDYKFDGYKKGLGLVLFRDNIKAVIFPIITIDVYCTNCKRETIFSPVKRDDDYLVIDDKSSLFVKNIEYAHFKCSRKQCKSNLFFIFDFKDGILTKIGQYPSIADIISPTIEKYGKVLEPDLIADWQRALGLKAHGIGAGSYVYLRKIIERMVMNAFGLALKSNKIDREKFKKSRYPQKIKMLSEFLPSYLIDNSIVYSILSKGVHELTEEECHEYFDVIHTSIEIICEEKLREFERAKKALAGKKSLQKVLKKIKGESKK